ncbi:MAG: acyl-CoA thioesterase [Ignavibacteriae bacterium]|nr:acyl-CoA thioesterase [Ignavibacteriota bacterium]
MEIENFKHKITEVVKFHEVDIMGVCNNAVYFNYFEDARIKYLQDLKKNYNLKVILENNLFFIMAHNECDYILPAKLDDELEILTKIIEIRNSSFKFEHLVINKNNLQIIAKGNGILVHINLQTKKSIPLPDEFYNAVNDFEKGVEINKNP